MILQVANDYSGSLVYKNYVAALDDTNLSQVIYTAIRNKSLIDKNKIHFDNANSRIIYSPILNLHSDRIFFKRKIKKILKDIETKIDVRTCSCIHAHTWFSDGGVAYELHKKYNIPYIIAVRNTDLNLFWKLPHLKNYGLHILKNASRIIFISKIYQDRVLSNLKIKSLIVSKFDLIPNGVDDYWVKNREKRKKYINNIPNLLFIGKFSNGKNVMKLIKAFESLNKQGIPCDLNLIGGGGKAEASILEYIEDKNNIIYHGRIVDKKRLKKFYTNSDIYTMPSKAETFGLVYIEALSQGIPIVFTKNEGIDGLYKNNIGEAVNCNSIQSIAGAIKKIILNYNHYDFIPENIVKNHDWKEIATKYIEIYNSVIE